MKLSVLSSYKSDHNISGGFDIFMIKTGKGKIRGIWWSGPTKLWGNYGRSLYLGNLSIEH